MLELTIPGRGVLHLQHLVADVNGTLALDGFLIDGLVERIAEVREHLTVHLLTADTHNRQESINKALNLTATIRAPGSEPEQKRLYVEKLGADTVVVLGQGANDAGMLESAALGICVMSAEGASVEALLAADLVVPDINAAFDILDKPLRIVASLRK